MAPHVRFSFRSPASVAHCNRREKPVGARAVVPVRRQPFASGHSCARVRASVCPRMAAMLSNCSRFAPRVITRSSVLRAEVSTPPHTPLFSPSPIWPVKTRPPGAFNRRGGARTPRGASRTRRLAGTLPAFLTTMTIT